MTIIRDKCYVDDKNISWEAKGLFAYLSRHGNFDLDFIESEFGSIEKPLKELQDKQYIIVDEV